MTDQLTTTEIHDQTKEKIRESSPTELRNNAQRERVECDIDGTIRGLELKFRIGMNAHVLVDAKRKEIKSITHDHDTNTKDLDFSEDVAEQNREEIQKLDRVSELMEMAFKSARGE